MAAPHSISVAMCTFNGSRFVSEQLRSIASQTRFPDELIICDDGSVDETRSILTSFAAKARFPVRIFVNRETLGPAKNFEKAISICSGEVIVLTDQDDSWKPDKLSRLSHAFERFPDAVYAFSDAEMVKEDGEPLGHTLWDELGLRQVVDRFSGANQIGILLRHNLIAGSSMAFRANFRSSFLPIPSGWMHDYWIVLLGSALSEGVPISEPLYLYRRHSDQVCGWRKKTFGQVVRDSIAAGQEDSWGKLQRFQALTNRLQSLNAASPCPEDRLDLIREKETHLLKRAAVRSARGISRILGVFTEASTGRYKKFSNSWYSVVRDLS